MEKIRAKHTGYKRIYIHNDLSNAAHYFKEKIEKKLSVADLEGISFEYMACLIMLVFSFEARINFLGSKLIKNWKERQPFKDKINNVLTNLKINPDYQRRPYSSIKPLKEFRELIAHGKPVEVEFDEEIEIAPDMMDRKIDLSSEWVIYCNHEFVFNAREDTNKIWNELLKKSKIELHKTITHGRSRLTFDEGSDTKT